ncbi:ac34 [Artaxa digramma nucleopolyhedrovirus]|uniref:Ac34 n=1 Tax=Artaxa digramma nucleopolyhedrovirus TaxID=3070910 RepID=A0AAE6R6J8_9ABAC|nr:ac34 [Euproctis digramma nucleopolyhedrovirus]QHB21710.1 ac34 [Artaxa digramma nucleopolyhedrovirus]
MFDQNNDSAADNDAAVTQFRADLARLTATILDNKPPHPDARLGDVIAHMSRNKLLLKNKKDENFDIAESVVLSDEAVAYLNALQTEKLYHCRTCYHKNAKNKCAFHAKYIFDKNRNENETEYINFLNSEMGIISFVELYYTYLCIDFWNITAEFVLDDLTGFKSVESLLNYYNYSCLKDVDTPVVNLMNVDDET